MTSPPRPAGFPVANFYLGTVLPPTAVSGPDWQGELREGRDRALNPVSALSTHDSSLRSSSGDTIAQATAVHNVLYSHPRAPDGFTRIL